MASAARPRTRAQLTPDRLVRSGLVVGGAIAIANGLTAVTQLALARLLPPADFSLVVTLFVGIAVAGVPLAALQATIARTVASDRAADGARGAGMALRSSAGELLRLSVPSVLLAVAVAVPVGILVNIQRVGPAILTGVVIAVSVGLTLVWGGLQGTQRFTALSLGQMGFAVVKLLAAVGAAWAGLGVGGVMAAIAAATAATFLVGLLPLVPLLRDAPAPRERRPLATRYSAAAVAALTLFALLSTFDVVVARLSFPPELSGRYAAASVAARALLLIPTAITTVLFPHVATLADRRRERKHLTGGLVATGALVGLPVGLLLVAGRPIVELVFGARYGEAGSWAGLLSVAMALYALAYVHLFHSLSLNATGYWRFALVVFALQTIALISFHRTPHDLVHVQLVAAALLAAGGHLLAQRRA